MNDFSLTTLSELYLKDRDGDIGMFQKGLMAGQRLGQALFNALSRVDQERLRGTIHDPFYKTKTSDLHKAIEFLLDTEK